MKSLFTKADGCRHLTVPTLYIVNTKSFVYVCEDCGQMMTKATTNVVYLFSPRSRELARKLSETTKV